MSEGRSLGRTVVVAALLLTLALFSMVTSASSPSDRPAALPYIDATDCTTANASAGCTGNDTGQWDHSATIYERNSSIGQTEAVVKLRIEGKGDPIAYRLQQTMIAMDDTGSMAWNDPNNTRFDAAMFYLDQLNNPDEVGFVIYSTDLPNGQYSELRSPLTTSYNTVKTKMYGSSSGSTPMIDGLRTASDELIPKLKSGYSWAVIHLTDGCYNTDGDPQPEVDRMVSEHIRMFNIGLYLDPNTPDRLICEPELRSWSNETGGKYYYVQHASDLRQVYQNISNNNGWGHSNDFAGSSPKNGTPMVVFKLTDDIEVVPGSFVCGAGCVDPTPSAPKVEANNSGLKLEWKSPVIELKIGQVWEVEFKVRSYAIGTKVAVNDVAESRIAYDQYDNTPGGSDGFEQLRLRVLPSVPTAPVDLKGELNGSKIDLSWHSPSILGGGRPPVLNYKIYKGLEPGKELYLASVDGRETKYVDLKVAPRETYYYRVSALNVMGEGPLSNEVNLTVPVTMFVPGPPRSLSAEPDEGTISLVWEPPLCEGYSPVIGYRIYRGPSLGEVTFVASVGADQTALSDGSVAKDITYYYAVSAFNAVGEGLLSDVANATVPGEIPGGEGGPPPVPYYHVRVMVRDAGTLDSIEFATINYGIDRGTFYSDERGQALITDTSPGKRRLSVTAEGYEPLVGYLVMRDYDSNVTLFMNKKVAEDTGNSPPSVDTISLSMFLLAVLVAEVVFLLIVYMRVDRSKHRTIAHRSRAIQPRKVDK